MSGCTQKYGLPDPFLRKDGSRVQTHEEWRDHRGYLKRLLEEYLYGHLPSPPETVNGKTVDKAKAYEGKALRERLLLESDGGISLDVYVIRPNDDQRHPAILWNQFAELEQCPTEEYAVCARGYAIVSFRREQIAPDLEGAETFDGGAFGRAYPQYDARAVAIWGWAHSLIVSYLLGVAWCDNEKLVVTGHSRGGKAALCAAALDERITLCAANASGQGGGGSLRYWGGRLGKETEPAESIGYLAKRSRFWYWFSDNIQAYGNQNGENYLGCEEDLPFDLHTIRALIAPRPIICTEGLNDAWSNVYGTQVCWRAAQEVYRFLGADPVNALFFREGGHSYPREAWMAVLDFCDSYFWKIPPKTLFRCFAPGEDIVPPLHFDWKAPEREVVSNG